MTRFARCSCSLSTTSTTHLVSPNTTGSSSFIASACPTARLWCLPLKTHHHRVRNACELSSEALQLQFTESSKIFTQHHHGRDSWRRLEVTRTVPVLDMLGSGELPSTSNLKVSHLSHFVRDPRGSGARTRMAFTVHVRTLRPIVR